jgi:2-keto-4-pentenoate hydratase
MNPELAAERLATARRGPPVAWRDIVPPDAAQAYRIQDLTLGRLGRAGAWKVGAKNADSEPTCAPLPLGALLASGVQLEGARWPMRGIEVEAAVRLSRDLHCDTPPTRDELARSIDAVMPAIELVETRLADWKDSPPLAQLADLQTHGALVLGAPSPMKPADLDLTRLDAELSFNGTEVARTHGGNTARDVWRLLGWLAVHCTRRGTPLKAGEVVTTGSCTGMLFAPAGAQVRGAIAGLGVVAVQF